MNKDTYRFKQSIKQIRKYFYKFGISDAHLNQLISELVNAYEEKGTNKWLNKND